MKRLQLSRRAWSRIGIIAGIALLVASGVLVLVTMLGPRAAAPAPALAAPTATTVQESPTPEPPSPTPEPSPTSSPIVASINGHTITQAYLQTATALNEVLSELAGQQSLGGEETLQRLIKQEIVLQGASLEDELTEQDVEDYIGRMQEAWAIDEETMMLELGAAGVERAFLEQTIHRLLSVQAAVESVESEGQSISEWLAKREAEADIRINQDVAGQFLLTPEGAEASPTPQVAPPTPSPAFQVDLPDVAPDFTLDRAGGGSFTLRDQLEEGPVVLVFFESCGWGPDRTQLVQLLQAYQSFQDAGAEVVALAVSSLSDVEEGVLRVINPPYPVLADPEHQVADAFNVYDLLGTGYAAPSTFVIDTDGDIVWSYVAQSRSDRPDAASVLEQLP